MTATVLKALYNRSSSRVYHTRLCYRAEALLEDDHAKMVDKEMMDAWNYRECKHCAGETTVPTPDPLPSPEDFRTGTPCEPEGQ